MNANTETPASSCEIIEEHGMILMKNTKLVYSHIFSPHSQDETKEPKFSITATFPKTDKQTFQDLFLAIEDLIQGDSLNIPLRLKPKNAEDWQRPNVGALSEMTFLHDGDAFKTRGKNAGEPRHEGCWYITASTSFQPKVLDAAGQLITDDLNGCYRGAFVNVLLSPWAYRGKGKGDGLYCNVMLVHHSEDGERLGGGGLSAATDHLQASLGIDVSQIARQKSMSAKDFQQSVPSPARKLRGDWPSSAPRKVSAEEAVAGEFDDLTDEVDDSDLPF